MTITINRSLIFEQNQKASNGQTGRQVSSKSLKTNKLLDLIPQNERTYECIFVERSMDGWIDGWVD